MSKGSTPRPLAIPTAEYGRRYDLAFAPPCPRCGATQTVLVHRPRQPAARQCVPCGHEWRRLLPRPDRKA